MAGARPAPRRLTAAALPAPRRRVATGPQRPRSTGGGGKPRTHAEDVDKLERPQAKEIVLEIRAKSEDDDKSQRPQDRGRRRDAATERPQVGHQHRRDVDQPGARSHLGAGRGVGCGEGARGVQAQRVRVPLAGQSACRQRLPERALAQRGQRHLQEVAAMPAQAGFRAPFCQTW